MEESGSPKTRAHQVQLVLDKVYMDITAGELKSSVADFVKLIQVSGELMPDDDSDRVTVEWVETIEVELVNG